MKKNKISTPETLLLAALFLCYVVTIYFIFQNNMRFLLLFFILHSCLAVVYFLVSTILQKPAQSESSPVLEFSSHRSLQQQFMQEKTLELERARRQNAKQQKIIQTLTSRIQDLEQTVFTLENAAGQLPEQNADEAVAGLLPPLEEDGKSRTALDIISAAQRVIDEMYPFTQKAGIQVQLSSSSTSLMVKASPSYIRILFRNIIDNSVKYMGQEGRLIITISSIGDDLFIVLKDNGKGLAKEETERIFELNYQGSNRISGNGLGLTQARAIVQYYGGTIYARSGEGSGMAVYIQLPSAKDVPADSSIQNPIH